MPWIELKNKGPDANEVKTSSVRRITYRDALLEATEEMLASDPSVIVMGEGVDDAQGVFGTTAGLKDKFGGERVFDVPLAENGLTGIAIGACLAGLRPIFVHMRNDFLLTAMDQIANHAAKWSYMFGGRMSVPLTIRAIIGRGWGSGAQHSQALHSLFAHIPGLKVVMPSTPFDAKGLLRASILDNNPVIFIEHRRLYDKEGPVPEGPYTVPIGEAGIIREGHDLTIVAISHMADEAMLAAEELEKKGIDIEIIDLRTIAPMDSSLIIDSVRKTGRLIVVDVGWLFSSISSEILAIVAEKALDSLKAAPIRIGLPGVPTPACNSLENAYYPGKKNIIDAVNKALGNGK